jgi:hypothetical protein
MNQRTARWTVLAFACLLAAACKERPEPIKPPVNPIAAAIPAH